MRASNAVSSRIRARDATSWRKRISGLDLTALAPIKEYQASILEFIQGRLNIKTRSQQVK